MSYVQSSCSVGSEWRRWDLHVHTPASIVGTHYGSPKEAAWETFIRDLEELPDTIKVVGICDYWFLEGYRRVLDYRAHGRLHKLECILPVVELRVDKFAGTNADMTNVNLHVVFSETLSPDTIQEQFLGHLECHREFQGGEPELSGYITPDFILKVGEAMIRSAPKDKPAVAPPLQVGFDSVCVSLENVYDQLRRSTLLADARGNRLYMTVLGRNEWNDVRWDGQGAAEKITMAQRADLFFGAAPTLQQACSAQSSISRSVGGRYIHCSDAHFPMASTQSNRLGHCLTWIKADPTFEGLRQIVLDYEDRVQISEANPMLQHPHQFFSKLALPDATALTDEATSRSVKFGGQSLPLNPNLVTVIGGRGSGKSLLLRALSACNIDSPGTVPRDEPEISPQCDVHLEFTQPTGEQTTVSRLQPGSMDFLYVGQGDVNRAVESPLALSKSLDQLLGLTEHVVGASLDAGILANLTEVAEIGGRAHYFDDAGKRWKSDDYWEVVRTDALARIESLKTVQTQGLIDKLTKALAEKQKVEQARESMDQLSATATSMAVKLNAEANRINGLYPAAKVPIVDMKEYKGLLALAQGRCVLASGQLEKSVASIRQTFSELGVGSDPEEALKLIKEHQKTVDDSNARLAKLQQDERRLVVFRATLPELSAALSQEIESRKCEIAEAWTRVKSGTPGWNDEQRQTVVGILEGVEVRSTVQFAVETLCEEVSRYLNGRKFRKSGDTSLLEHVRQTLAIGSLDDFLSLVANQPQVELPDEEAKISLSEFVARPDYFSNSGSDGFLKVLLTSEQRDKYLKVIPTILYDGKSLSALSIGQRGTVFIAIKLATSTFGVPFVYDQPEDDLDQVFISERLVPILRKIKQYRQVIIVTHNGNLVVNADAEQVIVAQNAPAGAWEELSYCSGSLESGGPEGDTNQAIMAPNIRLLACRILEGGTEAFQQREQRYGLAPGR